MSTQLPLFDRVAAENGRDDGMGRAARGAPTSWKSRALDALEVCARQYREFIVDDVWKCMDPADVPHEPRAMGPIMKMAQSQGIIEATGKYRLSDRRTAHRNPRQVWRSL